MTQALPTPEADPTFAQAWEALAPGDRASRGVYSVYKTREHSLLISYRPETLADGEPDQVLEVPAKLMQVLALATEGKLSPMEILSALKALRGGFGS